MAVLRQERCREETRMAPVISRISEALDRGVEVGGLLGLVAGVSVAAVSSWRRSRSITATFVLNFNRNRLGVVPLELLSRRFERQKSPVSHVTLDRLGIDVFGQHVTSGELSLNVAAAVVRLFFVLAVDNDAVVASLDGDLVGREVSCVDANGELVRRASDRARAVALLTS